MKRSAGLRYGTVYHVHLHSSEVDEVRKSDHKAYMLWLHLQATTFSGVDSWKRSMGAMSRDLGCGASSLRRWAATLERHGLLQRESRSLSKEEQVWTLLTPPSCRGKQEPVAKAAKAGKAARIAEVRSELESYRHTLESYYNAEALERLQGKQLADAQENRDELVAECAALELELESLL